MIEYYNNGWQSILAANDLGDFDSIWNLNGQWFEQPNIRRGGWSGVVKLDLNTPQGKIGVFIKRQQNHTSKTFSHPIKGIAPFQKEFNNILQLTNKNIATLEPVYFSQQGGQAILITKELSGYIPLDSKKLSKLNQQHKQALLAKITSSSLLHHWRFQHNCFYPKHIFVKTINGQWDVRFIDLEKLRRPCLKKYAVIRDLSTLN